MLKRTPRMFSSHSTPYTHTQKFPTRWLGFFPLHHPYKLLNNSLCIFRLMEDHNCINDKFKDFLKVATYLFGSPLESSYYTVFYLIQILNSFSAIDQQIWTCTFWTKTPNFTCFSCIPFIFINQISGTFLDILTRGNVSLKVIMDINIYVNRWTEKSVLWDNFTREQFPLDPFWLY